MFDAGTSHTFFVVDEEGDRIACEQMTLVEGPEARSTFDRAVFERDYRSRFSGLAAYCMVGSIGKRSWASAVWRHQVGSDRKSSTGLICGPIFV